MSVMKLAGYSIAEFSRIVFNKQNKCNSDRRLEGKVVVITGANAGIGKETAYQLALRGAKVFMSCRSIEKGEEAVSDVKLQAESADITLLRLDLASMKSVRQFAQTVAQQTHRIDILVNNAGVMACPEWKTTDGFEMQFGTNHLGHFLLTMHLLPLLKKSPNARIITVSSSGHLMGKMNFDNINLNNGAYSPFKAYAQSKLANILFTRELAKRLGTKSNVRTYSLHPGPVYTELQRHSGLGSMGHKMAKKFFLTPEMGAQTTLYCALEDSLDKETGCYYANCHRVDNMISSATDDKSAERLWDLSCDLVDLEDHLRLPAIKTTAWQDNNNNNNN